MVGNLRALGVRNSTILFGFRVLSGLYSETLRGSGRGTGGRCGQNLPEGWRVEACAIGKVYVGEKASVFVAEIPVEGEKDFLSEKSDLGEVTRLFSEDLDWFAGIDSLGGVDSEEADCFLGVDSRRRVCDGDVDGVVVDVFADVGGEHTGEVGGGR